MFQTLTLPSNHSCLQFCPINGSAVKPHRLPPTSLSCRASAAVEGFTETSRNLSPPTSLYDVLKVKRNASLMEIKMAYRNLAKLYHPDVSPEEESDGRDFIEIRKAYETLSDPAARDVYDLSLGLKRRRERRLSSPSSSFCRPGFYPTRRWETDQCW
ncbi:hypothetical protein Ancab_024862 [Ancistrocladus abbreviatus]